MLQKQHLEISLRLV